MSVSPEASSPYALLAEVERARDVLVLSYTASLEFFERFALPDARALGALVTVLSDATMVRADPVVVRRAGVQYLDARAVCPAGLAFHPKLVVIVGDGQARVAIGSGNLTVAGWHGNAETWTVLRADSDGGPGTLRDVSAFLRALPTSPVALSARSAEALERVAAGLDELPADQPGPRLLHSLSGPIFDQLPSPAAAVEELVLHAPFHDRRLDGVRALLDRLAPARWTVFVQPDTEVDGPALQALADECGGEVAWLARRLPQDDGTQVHDNRYRHGKLAQWRTADGETWALTGSPNLSRPALLQAVGAGGNCELAILSRIAHDLTPLAGDPPVDGLDALTAPAADVDRPSGPVLLSAVASAATVTVELHRPLTSDGTFERYDVTADRWTATASVAAGADRYLLDSAAAQATQALRLRTVDGAVSNEVFVADPVRLRRRHQPAIGKVRATPEDVVRDGLGSQMLNDIDELRSHLLAVGATVRVPRLTATEADADQAGEEQPTVARPAEGQTLEEFLEACDPVLGRPLTEYALVLPALPGVGAALDDGVGTLDSDGDDVADDDSESERTPLSELLRRTPDERRRYRWFVQRLVQRSPGYPLLVRNLALRMLLHAIAADLWSRDEWPDQLAAATVALEAPSDEEARPEVRSGSGSLAAVGLARLRTDVPRMSQRDERQLRYTATARAVAGLLEHRDDQQIELIAGELADHSLALGAEQAVAEVLQPPTGIERAVQLLADDHDLAAHARGSATIVVDERIEGLPELTLILALRLAEDSGPLFARGETPDGRPFLAAWWDPWLAVEKVGIAGLPFGRAWKLRNGETLHHLDLREGLPRAEIDWLAGQPRPDDVDDLLALADED